MALKPLIWFGSAYTISIRRHPRTFFAHTTICEINRPMLTKFLPAAAGRHITRMYEIDEGAKSYFSTLDAWYFFSRELCDQYCDFYVMQRWFPGNVFADFGEGGAGVYPAQELARQSKGYIGPRWWSHNH